MNNLYVRKKLSSLDKLGGAVAVFLKRGLAVQLQYGVKERDIVVRFHKRLERLYNDDLEAHGAVVYPVQGFVVLDRNKVITSETKMEKSDNPNLKATFNLVYDPLCLKEIWYNISDMLMNLGINVKTRSEKERW